MIIIMKHNANLGRSAHVSISANFHTSQLQSPNVPINVSLKFQFHVARYFESRTPNHRQLDVSGELGMTLHMVHCKA